ncbi:MAG: hypothetical protein GY863_03860, partial [bacterium]|nr:hypothetical protein [bacterium]
SVATAENFAYVTDENFGLKKIDISDPSSMKVVAEFKTSGEPSDVALYGEYVLIADGFSLIILK